MPERHFNRSHTVPSTQLHVGTTAHQGMQRGITTRAEAVEDETLTTLVANKLWGLLQRAVVRVAYRHPIATI